MEAGKAHFLGKPFVVDTPEDAIEAVKEDQELGCTHMVMWMQIG